MDVHVPALLPGQLGSRELCLELGLRFAYIGGSMAKGISSVASYNFV